MVTPVDEPAKYGKSVVVPHDTGLIDKFVEHGTTRAVEPVIHLAAMLLHGRRNP